ncbi:MULTISPECIES: ABC transporter substrate-binding protein [Glaesserella]|uniref:ABC transporter substrate-binding protein n=1 Tax=Glaesserella australis TaxID=2094024 RepID=A0A328BZF9_9PAST|nr:MULTISPECIES: ABC transporter substrate-binding protein [Glaesserella]AUI65479.1 ABC transporter substrate-binding protein [Glaesserella sp. 15-184]RAL19676.1 ABC transporter substrate-binding protein [Glaesserella australis]
MKKYLQAVGLSSFFAIFLGYSSAYASPKIPQPLLNDSLVYCTSASGFSFNPQKADAGSNINVVTEQIYDKLIEFDPEQNRLKPALAERFEVSDDGLTLTFYLRKKVSFHHTKWFTPTRYLTSEDVVFSLNRVLGKVDDLPELNREVVKKIQSPLLADRAYFSYFESIDLSNKIVSVSAPSAHVVTIQLTQPDSSILAHLASQYAVILSKEYALQLNADENLVQLDILPIGTGVYQLENYVQNDFVRLQPNGRYWGDKAKITNMVVDFSTSGTGRMAKFMNRECDIAAFPEPSQLSALQTNQGYIVETDGANLAFLAFNFQKEKMKDPLLRQKIAQSIDRDRLARILFYGVADVAQNVLPKALYAEANLDGYPYQPEIRKKNEVSDRLILWVIDEKRVYNLHPLKMAEYLRSELAKAGIEIEVKQVSRAYLVQQLEQGNAEYDLILSGWLAHNFDPNSFLSSILSCRLKDKVTNLSNWCSLEFDELLNQAEKESDPQRRLAYYQQIQALLEERLPLLPLLNVKRLLVVNNTVEHVKISPFGQVELSKIKVK